MWSCPWWPPSSTWGSWQTAVPNPSLPRQLVCQSRRKRRRKMSIGMAFGYKQLNKRGFQFNCNKGSVLTPFQNGNWLDLLLLFQRGPRKMIKFDHFSRFQKDFRQKMQGLHKIDHNSRKKLKTQGWKTQNSSKKLKVSAKSKTRFAENRSKKKADLGAIRIYFHPKYESSPLTLVENDPNTFLADCKLLPRSFGIATEIKSRIDHLTHLWAYKSSFSRYFFGFLLLVMA